MFAPTASPVVQRQSTWHIGPTTCVFTSRRRANLESDASSRSSSQARMASRSASIQRASSIASAAEPQTKHEARVMRSASTYVRKPPDSATARAPRCSDAERPPSVWASGTKTESWALPVSATAPSGSRSSYSPSSTSSGPTTETGITAAPVSISWARVNGSRSTPVTSPSSPSASCRARIESSSFLRGHFRISTVVSLSCRDVTTTDQVIDQEREEREAFAGVLRFYELAKRQEWQVRDLPWGELPPIPEGKGSPQRQARRKDMWRSVLTQQLQADMLACEMASQLLNIAPDPEAKLYYSTMVQDESRHTEAWLKLIEEAGGTAERDPYLDELAHMTLEADTLEEKVFQMQVFYERLIISRFRLIARASRGTVLEDVCNRLTTDDGIHHGAGMAYEKVLLQNADKKMNQRLVDAANRLLPIFIKHALWRPKERAFIGNTMRSRDIERLREDIEIGVRLAESLGLDVSDVQLPIP